MTAAEYYQDRNNQLQEEQKKLNKKKNAFAWLRLACIAALIAAFYFLMPMGWGITTAVVVILLFIFVQLIYKDLNNKASIAHNKQLLQINEAEIKALQGQYYHFADGTQHIPKDHFYANDMDIFGHASLFQFMNRSVSEMGSAQLAHWLLHPASAQEIPARQEAVKELGKKNNWSQNLQAFGKENPISLSTRERLQQWLHEAAAFSNFKHWGWLRYALPFISVSITVATIFSNVSMNIFYSTMLLMAIIAFSLEKKIGQLHNRLSKMVDELETLSQSIETIESQNFQSALLAELQHQYKPENSTASKKINQLKKILDRLDLRFNIVLAVPLNLLFLWNLQQVLELEKWKTANDADVRHWFDSLGIFEALVSFATIHFNNPSWIFPTLKEEHFYIESTGLGHPLIHEKKTGK